MSWKLRLVVTFDGGYFYSWTWYGLNGSVTSQAYYIPHKAGEN